MRQSFSLDKSTTTYLRAISILAVIIGHILGGSFGLIGEEWTSLLGNSGVTIFLLLSGYGLYTSYKAKGIACKSFWSSKIKKIFIPYVVITVVYYACMYAANKAPGLIALIENIFCIDFVRKMDSTMWYMSFLLIWYVLFFFIFYFDYPDTIKILLLFLFGALFKRRWNQELFDNCAAQFSRNAFVFPVGTVIGFLFHKLRGLAANYPKLFDRTRLIYYTVVLACSILFVLGLFDVFSFSDFQNGFLLFVILYFAFSWLKPGMPVLHWIGEKIISSVPYRGEIDVFTYGSSDFEEQCALVLPGIRSSCRYDRFCLSIC